jgi:hypothetical protein
MSQPAAPLKLDYFESALRRRAGGAALADAFQTHIEEVLYLVNNNRRVAVVWQRNQGPSFINAALAGGAAHEVVIPKEVNGVALETLLLRMADVLQRHGSLELRQAIAAHSLRALRWSRECKSFSDVLQQLQ